MNTYKNKEKTLLEKITDIYMTIMILFFPLMIDDTGYFHILEHKWHSFLFIGLFYIVAVLIVIFYYEIIKKTGYIKKLKMCNIIKILIIYIIINTISCILSPFFTKYNLFVGVGRGEGLIMIMLYTISFILISFFGKFKKKYFIYFSICSIIISIIGIFQFLGLNPLNLYQDNIGIYNVSFLTTIGNIDFVSAFYCLYLPISVCSFIFLKNNKLENIIHILSILFSVYIISLINVQSGQIAFLIIILILIPFILINNDRLSKFIIVLTIILMSFLLNMFIGTKYDYIQKVFKSNFKFNYITIIYIVSIIILIFFAKFIYKKKYDFTKNKNIIKYLYIGIIIMIIVGITFIYFYNFKGGILYELHEILHGNLNDEFGTYRIFLWKRTLKIFPDYPLIGSGPDTFAIRFMERFTNDIASIGPLTINDTAANVYLTILINSGILGFVTYILFLIYQIIKSIKKINIYSSIILISLLAFMIQDFFNLSVVIVTPLFWVTMAVHYITFKDDNFIENHL